MSGREPCDRLPCDRAYRRQPHTPDEHGLFLHRTSVSSGTVNGQQWRVDVVAVVESTWTVRLKVPELVIDSEADELHELGQAIARAAMWCARANLHDAWEDAAR